MAAHDAVTAFRDLVTRYSYKERGQDLLTNITFFVGAGFSKSWDRTSPTGNELFTFTRDFLEESATEIEVDELLTQPGYPTLEDTAPAKFKELVYNVSMQLKYPGIRTRYMDESSLTTVLNEIKALVLKRFEEITTIPYYDEARGCFPLPAQLTAEQQHILDFYAWLWSQKTGTGGVPRGIHFDFLSTNYDYLVEVILDNIVTGERMFRNTYRGVTPVAVCGQRNKNVVQDYWSVNTLIKINGGFEIVPTPGGYHFDYRRRSFEDVRQDPPEIMLPSREQSYTNPYFASIFPKAVRLLQESRILVIIGYSLSEDDALLRFLIRQFAEDLRDVYGKYIFYIGFEGEDVLKDRLQGCFRYLNYMDARNIYAYSGGLTEWIKNILAGV